MELRLRPYAAAGVALVGASAIALAPVAPPMPDIKIANPGVNLSAAIDPFTPWRDVLANSFGNVANLVGTWGEAPLPVLQQIIVNQFVYLSELPDFEAIVETIIGNAESAAAAPFTPGPESVDPAHAALLQALPSLDVYPPSLQPLIDFAASPASGILFGLVGPVVAPLLALSSSIHAIIENMTSDEPDFEAALNTLINIPASMANAFLNGGQTLDLTPVLDALGVDIALNPNFPTKVGLTFGGLLSGGGSIINALDIGLETPIGVQPIIPGHGPGAIGSAIGLAQAIARALGWSGHGNPLAVLNDAPPPPPELRSGGAGDTALLKASTTSITVTDTGSEEVTSGDPAPEATPASVEETPAPTEEAGGAPVVLDDEVAAEPVTKPSTKKVNPGAKIAGALKTTGDNLRKAVDDLGKKLTKRPTKKAPATENNDAPANNKSDAPSNDSSDAAA